MVLVNDISKSYPGKVIYSPMCYPDGGVVDDLLVMCMDTNKYLLIVNGANTDKDVEWIEPLARYFNGTTFENISDDRSQWRSRGLTL